MKFSIIVPVYKVEDYLDKCVSSILNQTYKNFELILVDDGSPDSCPRMCDKYAEVDKRIIVIHKPNGGLSSARNAGINVSSGDYLVFVDSDDWIELDSLENFYKVLKKQYVDVLMTVKTSFYSDQSYQEVDCFGDYYRKGFDKKRAVYWMLYGSKSVGAPNKIVKRDFVNQNDLKFFEGILHEDYDWTFKLCLYATSFAGYDGKWYNYRMIREGSITNRVSPKSINSIILTTRVYYDLYLKKRDWISEEIYHKSMDALYVSLNKIKYVDSNGKEEVVEYLRNNIVILKYARRINQKMFLIICRLFGANVALTILRIIP